MATMMTTLFASLGAGGAAAAGAGAAAGAAGAGGLVSGLSIASTVVGGLSAIFGANQEAAALDSAARDEDFRATQEELQGRQDALEALRGLNDTQAAIAVAGFSSGLGGAGSIQAAQEEAVKIGEDNIDTARFNARARSSARRNNAAQLRTSAKGTRIGGLLSALKGGSALLQRRRARGDISIG